jgi:hypothetical protein
MTEPRARTGLESIGEGIWTLSAPLKLGGMDARTRTTVVKLEGGRLWVHSPCKLDDALAAEVSALGEVAFLVAPNLFHHMFVAQWKRRFPAARIYVAPGLEKKRANLNPDGVLSSMAEPGWAKDIDQVFMEGSPIMNEVVFLHRASRTLIVTDLLFHVGETHGALEYLFFKLNGVVGKAGRSLLGTWVTRDKTRARASAAVIRAWDFDRIAIAHRDMVETGGKEAFLAAFKGL